MSRKRTIRNHYEPRVTPDRQSYDVHDWADAASQRRRFEVLLAAVDLSGVRLLDVGCGLGDLLEFLDARGVEVDYTGVDIVEKMIVSARARHTAGRFLCADVFAADLTSIAELADRRYDVAYCSGTFNLNLGNNREFLPRAVARMLDLTDGHVVFNLLDARTSDPYSHCCYFEPADVLELLDPLPCACDIIDSYLPADFTVLCRKLTEGSPPR